MFLGKSCRAPRGAQISTVRTWRPRYIPLLGLTRCGRTAPPSAGSTASCGALKALAARRLALRRLDCLRFGLAMMKNVGLAGRLRCRRTGIGQGCSSKGRLRGGSRHHIASCPDGAHLPIDGGASGMGVSPMCLGARPRARCPCHSAGQQSARQTPPTIGRCACPDERSSQAGGATGGEPACRQHGCFMASLLQNTACGKGPFPM